MEWVVDASMALAWAFPDERSIKADQFLNEISAKDILWVPFLWWYEIANALVVAQRRKRLNDVDAIQLRKLYGILPIKTDTNIDLEIWEQIQLLAKNFNLSAYATAYLELALRKNLRLATLDQNLQLAAHKAGLKFFR